MAASSTSSGVASWSSATLKLEGGVKRKHPGDVQDSRPVQRPNQLDDIALEAEWGQPLQHMQLPSSSGGPCGPELKPRDNDAAAPAVDFKNLVLVNDHLSRPLWVCPDGRIIFETSHPRALEVADFLLAIAEPISRPEVVHEYQITMLSLNAAVAGGIEVETIMKLLTSLSKNTLDTAFVSFIQEQGKSTGKLKLVLRSNRHFLEAADAALLAKLTADPIISASLIRKDLLVNFLQNVADGSGGTPSVEINSLRVEAIKEAAHRMNLPLLQEYEYREDGTDANPELAIVMKPAAKVRPYQQRALSKMFALDGVAKSGIVVLPCGAGKTLVGIAAAARIKRRVFVLTSTAVAVDQWRRQFLEYTTIAAGDIYCLTAEQKRPIEDKDRRACVLISTYSMMGFGGKRGGDSALILEQIQQLEWGLLVVDEVQMMPARTFRTVATTVKSHCCLGLTATLVREDHLELDLHWLIGPKLYEANWQQLQDDGYLARVRCVEVWCEMAKDFFSEYLRAIDEKDAFKRNALWTCNPNKLRVCDYLIRRHEARGDKIIVFSDNIYILEAFAKKLQRYYICGKVDMRERMQILEKFQHSPWCNTIFLSKVGDNAIDIPNASVIIQISSHYGSRRQEAQRLGRILRPKPKSANTASKFNAFFYSLVSRDTQEMYYASKRQTFLVEQGYNYHVLREHNVDQMSQANLAYSGEDDQKQLLSEVLESLKRGDAFEDEADLALHDPVVASAPRKPPETSPVEPARGETASAGSGVVDQKVSIASLSGGLDGSYSVTAAFNRKLLKPDDNK